MEVENGAEYRHWTFSVVCLQVSVYLVCHVCVSYVCGCLCFMSGPVCVPLILSARSHLFDLGISLHQPYLPPTCGDPPASALLSPGIIGMYHHA